MTSLTLNRRVHLYLGLALLPWFLMYGVSSIPFAHNAFFDQRDRAKGLPQWTLRFESVVDVEFRAIPRRCALSAHDSSQAGIADTAFGTYRQSPVAGQRVLVLVLEVDAVEVLRGREEGHR